MPIADTPWGALTVNDAHVHFLSHRLLSMLAAMASRSPADAAATLGWTPPPEDPALLAELWAAELDRHGVSQAALISTLPGDEGSVVCAVNRLPNRFRGFMMVNPLADRAPENAAATLSGGAVRCLCLFPAMHGYPLRHQAVTPILDAASAANPPAAVFVHSGALSVGFRSRLGLPSPFDLEFSNPLALHPLAHRYPNLNFILPHFGSGLFREALMLADLCPNVHFDTSSSNRWMRYESPHTDLREIFRRSLEILGPSRLLFGTDSSFFPRGWNAPVFQSQAKALYEIGASVDDATRIFSSNFDRLFG